MRWLTLLLLGMAIGGAAVFSALQYHVIHSSDGHLFVPKTKATLADAYVDVREWSASDWRNHPDLINAVVEDGRADLVVSPTARDMFRGLFKNFGSAELPQLESQTQ